MRTGTGAVRLHAYNGGTSALDLICSDPRNLPLVLPEKVDFVLLPNALHEVADLISLARTVASMLNTRSFLAVVDWRPMPHEQTVVLGRPRGPKAGLHMTPDDVQEAPFAADLYLNRDVIDLPPFHWGAQFFFNGPKPLEVRTIERMLESGYVDPDIYVLPDSGVRVEQQRAEAEACCLSSRQHAGPARTGWHLP